MLNPFIIELMNDLNLLPENLAAFDYPTVPGNLINVKTPFSKDLVVRRRSPFIVIDRL